eukprot:GEMP01097318.1.p1 GENE.GEMP01097318.1~~GEMP01097318.1.p1  ORF type:complete len:144 (+),score=45.61 GEMP01097318.1:53-433(+)
MFDPAVLLRALRAESSVDEILENSSTGSTAVDDTLPRESRFIVEDADNSDRVELQRLKAELRVEKRQRKTEKLLFEEELARLKKQNARRELGRKRTSRREASVNLAPLLMRLLEKGGNHLIQVPLD